MKDVGIALRRIEQPTELRINLKKFPMPASHLKMDSKMTMTLEGKVTSIHKDEYGETCSIEVSSLKHGGENA